MGLANHADSQGCGAYAGQKLLAEYARKTDRQVRSDLNRLLDEKLIRRGDQSLAAHIAADCRPVVYDLVMERKQASARHSASARNQASPGTADQMADDADDLRESGGSGSGLPGGSEAPRERKPASYKPTTNQEPSSTKKVRAPRRNLNDGRDDAMRICVHLADRIEANGTDRPEISRGWLNDARLMLDKDNRTEQQVHAAIDWCQDDGFWRINILSMAKLRGHYSRLRLEAKAERDKARAAANGNGHRPARGGFPDAPPVSPRDEHKFRR